MQGIAERAKPADIDNVVHGLTSIGPKQGRHRASVRSGRLDSLGFMVLKRAEPGTPPSEGRLEPHPCQPTRPRYFRPQCRSRVPWLTVQAAWRHKRNIKRNTIEALIA